MFLVFLKHAQRGDDLILPVAAKNRAEAEQRALMQYPAPAYAVLTCYSAAALQGLLQDMQASSEFGLIDTPAPVQTDAERRAEVMARLAKTRRQTMLETMKTHTAELPQPLARRAPDVAPSVKDAPLSEQASAVGVMHNSHVSVNTYARASSSARSAAAPSLKDALALLREQGASGVEGSVVARQEAPVAIAPISRNPAAAATPPAPKIQRQPAAEPAAPVISRGPQSVIEVFKGLRR